jgi:hypothetical protein
VRKFMEVTKASSVGGIDGVVVDFPKNMAMLKWQHPEHGTIIRVEVRDDNGNVLESSPDIVAAESGGMKMACALALCFVPTFPFGEPSDTTNRPMVLKADGTTERRMVDNYDQARSRYLIAHEPLTPKTPADATLWRGGEPQPMSPELQAKACAIRAAGSPKSFPFPLPYSAEGQPGQMRELKPEHKCAGCVERGATPGGKVFWSSIGWLCTACNNNGHWTDDMLQPVPVPPERCAVLQPPVSRDVEPVPVTESPEAEPVLKHLVVFGALLPDPTWVIANAHLVEATNAYIIRRDNPVQSCRVSHQAMFGTRDEIVKHISEKLDQAIATFTTDAIPSIRAAHVATRHKPSNMNYPMSRLP